MAARYDELAYAVAAQTGFNMVNRSLKGLVERRVGSASGFKANIKLPEAAFDPMWNHCTGLILSIAHAKMIRAAPVTKSKPHSGKNRVTRSAKADDS
ncbi:MAG: hypothetical protein U1E47_05225 [Rivihabitans pingtungensis]